MGENLVTNRKGPMPGRRKFILGCFALSGGMLLGACGGGVPPGVIVPPEPGGEIKEGLTPGQVVRYLRQDFVEKMTAAGKKFPEYRDFNIPSPAGASTTIRTHLYQGGEGFRLMVLADTATSEMPVGALLLKPIYTEPFEYASWYNGQIAMIARLEPAYLEQIASVNAGRFPPQLLNPAAGVFARVVTIDGIDQVIIHPAGIPYPFASEKLGFRANSQSLIRLIATNSAVQFTDTGPNIVGARQGIAMVPKTLDRTLVVAGSAKETPLLALLDGKPARAIVLRPAPNAAYHIGTEANVPFSDGALLEPSALVASGATRVFKERVNFRFTPEEIEEAALGFLRGKGLLNTVSYASILIMPITLGIKTNNIESRIENISHDSARRLAADLEGANARFCQAIARLPVKDREGEPITLVIPFDRLKSDLVERPAAVSMIYTQEFTFPDDRVAVCNLPAAAFAVTSDEQGQGHFAVRFFLKPGQQANIQGPEGSITLTGPSVDIPPDEALRQIQWVVPNKQGEYYIYLPVPEGADPQLGSHYLSKVKVLLNEDGTPQALVFNFLGLVFPV